PETDEITFSAAQVQQLIGSNSGTDQSITVVFNSDISGNVTKVGGGNVMSKGLPVIFGTDGAAIVGFVENGSNPGFQPDEDRQVSRVTMNGDGSITFDLTDQIDHPWGSGEAALVELDLSSALLLKDFDGDTAPVDAGHFTVSVENDKPANTEVSQQVSVGED